MLKKIVVLFVTLFLALFLVACGGGEDASSNEDPGTDATEQQNNEDESKEDENTKESELGTLAIASLKKDLNHTVDSGPMKLTISAIQNATLEPSEEYKDMFDGKDQVTVITVNMKAENTSEDTISFYPDQATLTTNAGDQVEADLFFSDDVGGDFFGQVKKEGDVIFLLDTPAEDIKEIKLIISGAHDEDFESLSDDLQIELSF